MNNSSSLSSSSSSSSSRSSSKSSKSLIIYYHNLDNLPDDIYDFYLFKLLDLDDIWNLRLVNKRLYSVVKSYSITELSFLDFDLRLDNWFSTIKPTRSENQLDTSKLALLSNPSHNFLHLKHLRIQDYDSLSIKLADLNKFTKLQILEIGYIKSNSKSLINLPDLKALAIRFDYDGLKSGNLIINTPNLHSLHIEYFPSNSILIDEKIQITNPLSIKYLLINYHDKNMLKFSDLECLEFFFDSVGNFDTSDLLKFKKLKKLKFNYNYIEAVDKLKDLFRSKRDDLELILYGVKVNEIKVIDDFKRKKSELDFQMNNYARLEYDLNFICGIYYNRFARVLPSKLPSDLFAKYNNIQLIIVHSKTENENQLIYFIKQCLTLNVLVICKSMLKQQFYDRLPVIKSLSFLEIEREKDIDLNLDFIVKMPNLRIFYTDFDVQISKQLNLNTFKRLRIIKFKINNQAFNLRKECKDRYVIDNWNLLGLPVHEYISHNKLVKWSNYLRNKRETRSRKRKQIE